MSAAPQHRIQLNVPGATRQQRRRGEVVAEGMVAMTGVDLLDAAGAEWILEGLGMHGESVPVEEATPLPEDEDADPVGPQIDLQQRADNVEARTGKTLSELAALWLNALQAGVDEATRGRSPFPASAGIDAEIVDVPSAPELARTHPGWAPTAEWSLGVQLSGDHGLTEGQILDAEDAANDVLDSARVNASAAYRWLSADTGPAEAQPIISAAHQARDAALAVLRTHAGKDLQVSWFVRQLDAAWNHEHIHDPSYWTA